MTNRFFWLVATILLAVITHISTVLFTPRIEMPARFAAVAKEGVNSFRLFAPRMLKGFTARPLKHMLYGGCLVVPGEGRVEMKTVIPPGYWSVTLYSPAGDVIYTLNDRHAGVRRLTIVFQRKAGGEDNAIQAPRLRAGKLVVPMDEEKALAVTQVYVAHPGERRRKLKTLGETTCAARPEPLRPTAGPRDQGS